MLKGDLGARRGNIPKCNKRTSDLLISHLQNQSIRSRLDKDRRLGGTEKMVGNTDCSSEQVRTELDKLLGQDLGVYVQTALDENTQGVYFRVAGSNSRDGS